MSDTMAAAGFTSAVTARIQDAARCPVCYRDVLVEGRCLVCGADLRGDVGERLWVSSEAVVSALAARQRVIDTVPVQPLQATHDALLLRRPAPAPRTAMPPAPVPERVAPAPQAAVQQRSSASVQSVLAVAGAALFAVAAVVFTYLNPDLTDRGVRTLVLSIVAALFLGGAWVLAKRRLQFSAEAVGALGMVFLALDVSMIAGYAPDIDSAWLTAAVGTLVAGGGMTALALWIRIRSWLWIALLGLSWVPVMLGYALMPRLAEYGGGAVSGGHLASAAVACALIALTPRLAGRFDGRLRSERIALTVVQILAGGVGLIVSLSVPTWPPVPSTLPSVIALAVGGVIALCSVRHPAPRFWSLVAGFTLSAAVVYLGVGLYLTDEWTNLTVAVAAGLAVVGIGALLPLPRGTARAQFVGAVLALPSVVTVFLLALAAAIGVHALNRPLTEWLRIELPGDYGPSVFPLVLALGVLAVAATVFARLVRTRMGSVASVTRAVGFVCITAAALTSACLPTLSSLGTVIVALSLAAVGASALAFLPIARRLAPASRVILSGGAHLAIVLGATVSWTDARLGAGAGLAVVAAIALVACTVPARFRFLHVGAGYAYALVTFAVALDLAGVSDIAWLCLTSALGSLGAIVATFVRRIPERSWHAILVVTAVPFVIGVVQVFFERSGWTALSTGFMFALALTLLLTRERRVHVSLRAISAGLLVPTLAVMTVCLVAQLPESGSPIALPIIAVLVALTLSATALIRSALESHHLTPRHAGIARLAIEGSALLTGALAVALGLWREAAGLGTTCVVLLILAVGGAGASMWAKRRYGWWLAFACATGALWCVWALAGITVLEPYLLPPTLGAALIAFLLALRGRRTTALFGAGIGTAIVPLLVMLAIAGTPAPAATAWRGYGILAAAWLLAALGTALAARPSTSLRALAAPAFAGAIVASAAGAIQSARFGFGLDGVDIGGTPLILLALGLGLAGAIPAAVSGAALRRGAAEGTRLRRSRWLLAPTLAILAAAAWPAIHRDWFTIWTMWALMLVFLIGVVATAARVRSTRSTMLPPVWFVFAIAFVTAIVAWSPRDLRVEWFSLPLGVFLLAAGVLFLREATADAAIDTADPAAVTPRPAFRLSDWPAGWTGSWAVLGPGLVVTVLASIVATFTDPLTWRAILVIVCALLMILWGARAKLRAPFALGIVVLPIENIFAFMVQIGRGIESMPWWITLAVVGAVLLIIAVSYERRAGGDNTITARMRDLR